MTTSGKSSKKCYVAAVAIVLGNVVGVAVATSLVTVVHRTERRPRSDTRKQTMALVPPTL